MNQVSDAKEEKKSASEEFDSNFHITAEHHRRGNIVYKKRHANNKNRDAISTYWITEDTLPLFDVQTPVRDWNMLQHTLSSRPLFVIIKYIAFKKYTLIISKIQCDLSTAWNSQRALQGGSGYIIF